MWNIIKSGIFTQDGKEARAEDDLTGESGGIIAVWGAPGSGKTSVAVKLAKLLTDKNKPVALLLCDMTAPMLPCICPKNDMEDERSLKSIFAATHPSESLIKHNAVRHKRIGGLMMFGLLKGENEHSCRPQSEEQVAELLQVLESMAPYVIVDCSSYISGDILSAVALMEADCVLRLSGCDLKSVSYFSSQLPLLTEAKWDADKQIKIASNVKLSQMSEAQQEIHGKMAFTLPHSVELSTQYLNGDLFENLSNKESRLYRKELKKICREVFGC